MGGQHAVHNSSIDHLLCFPKLGAYCEISNMESPPSNQLFH